MKYSIENYVNALTGVLEGSSKDDIESVLRNFVEIISKNGDISKGNKIIEAFHRKIVNLNGGRWINVELARDLSESKKRILKESFFSHDYINFSINSYLVAGIRITIDGERELDNSLEKKLKKVFKI